jgi:hypothetical protein
VQCSWRAPVLCGRFDRRCHALGVAIVAVTILAGFELFGPAGAMVAVPTVAAIDILVPELAAALASPTPLSESVEQ